MTRLMRGAVITAALLFSFSNTFSQDDTSIGADLVATATAESWEAFADDMGSTIDTGSSLITDGILSISLTRVAQPDTNSWPYIDLLAYTDSTYFNGATTVYIEYKSSHDLAIALPMLAVTDEDGSAHRAVLSPATDWQLDTLPIDAATFVQPFDVDDDLDLSKVLGFSFTNEIDDYTAEQTSNFQLKQIFVSYETGITYNYSKSNVQSFKINHYAGKLFFSIPKQSEYTISVLSLNGKEISKIKSSFNKGITSVSTKDLGLVSGSYVVRIKSATESFSAKAIIK